MPELSEEQMQFVKYALAGHNVLVDACIGSGKTTAIQALCNYVPTKRILYLTYNKLLKLDAKDKIRNPYVNVTNYHGFAWAELNRVNVRSGLSELIMEYNRVKPPVPRYDLLILDEYQDITQEIADMLLHIKAGLPDLQIVAVGDMEQKIYDWTRLDVRTFIRDFLGTFIPMEFTRCFRLGETQAASLGRIWKKEIVGVNPDFTAVHVPAEDVFDEVKNLRPGELLVLGSRAGKAQDLQNELEERRGDIFNKRTLWSKIKEGDGATNPQKGCAIFTTYDGCKGMERDVCVLYDWTNAYWQIRCSKPDTRYEILRNVFLVAASRAKKRLIVVDAGDELSEDALMDDPGYYMPRGDVPISEMFDYKYAEDVEEAYNAVSVRTLAEPGTKLTVPLNDELIDLSPCIGHYQEASYFTDYDLDEDLEFMLDQPDRSHLRRSYKKYSVDQKLLYLAALETKQNRYMNQVKALPITEANRDEIKARLGHYLRPDLPVQKHCSIDFFTRSGNSLFTANGILDVLDGDVVWELKFVSELSHVHVLQLAMYLVAMGKEEGRLYNTRTGELLEVRIPDGQVFLDRVVTAVTKGGTRKAYTKTYQAKRTKEERKTVRAERKVDPYDSGIVKPKTDAERFEEFYKLNWAACERIYDQMKRKETYTQEEIRQEFRRRNLKLPVSTRMFMVYMFKKFG